MKTLVFGLSLCFVLLLGSCVTTSEKAVFDESVLIEDSAWIMERVGKIVNYNGIPVDWTLGTTGMARIPAGDTILEWNINYSTGLATFRGDGLIMRYNFLPSFCYTFMVSEKNNQYGLNVYAFEFDEKLPITWNAYEEHFVGFAPFLNMGGNAGKTVLN
jgi:hypothetical protein